MTTAAHPETDLVHALADGELEQAEADRLRAHIVTCDVCTRELDDVTQLKLIEGSLRRSQGQVLQLPKRSRAIPRVAIAWAASVLVLFGLGFMRARKAEADADRALAESRAEAVKAQAALAAQLDAERKVRAGLESELTDLKKPRTDMPVLALNRTRGAAQAQTLRLAHGQRWFVLTIDREDPPAFEVYRARITAGATQVWATERLDPSSRDSLSIAFPTATVPPGEYELSIEGQGRAGWAPVARLPFKLVQEK
ncbi:MAG: zf-HC2 domain-containing protein [Deltaproteobacteria bacterium]|nr:zf-HC2 domain-containing protein [Deltaproteobacteria bacterium]